MFFVFFLIAVDVFFCLFLSICKVECREKAIDGLVKQQSDPECCPSTDVVEFQFPDPSVPDLRGGGSDVSVNPRTVAQVRTNASRP